MKVKTGLAIGMMAVNGQSGKTKSAHSDRYPNEQAQRVVDRLYVAKESIPSAQAFCDSPPVHSQLASCDSFGDTKATVTFHRVTR